MRKTLLAVLFILGAFPTLAQRGVPFDKAALRADDCTTLVVPAGQTLICIDNDDAKVYRCTSTGTCVEAVPSVATDATQIDFDLDSTLDFRFLQRGGGVDVVLGENNTIGTPHASWGGMNLNFGAQQDTDAANNVNSMPCDGTADNRCQWRYIFGGIDTTVASRASGAIGCFHCDIDSAATDNPPGHSISFGGSYAEQDQCSYCATVAGYGVDLDWDGTNTNRYSLALPGHETKADVSYAVTSGHKAYAHTCGQMVRASGGWGDTDDFGQGEAQGSWHQVQADVTGTSWVGLFACGVAPYNEPFQVRASTSVAGKALCVAQDADADASAYYEIDFLYRGATDGTVSEVYERVTVHHEDVADWQMRTSAWLGGVYLQGAADTGNTVNFMCDVRIAEVMR